MLSCSLLLIPSCKLPRYAHLGAAHSAAAAAAAKAANTSNGGYTDGEEAGEADVLKVCVCVSAANKD